MAAAPAETGAQLVQLDGRAALLAKLLLDPAPDLATFWSEARFAELRLAEILRD